MTLLIALLLAAVSQDSPQLALSGGVLLPTARTVSKCGKESTEAPWPVELLSKLPKKAFERQ